jgi:hypothetical protein
MKKTTLLPLIAFVMSSCAVSNYYQVYKTTPENGTISANKIVFEDNNCTVTYDLWNEGGNVGFTIANKSENDLTVMLSKTFFILNGMAYEYYQNRTFSKSSNTGASWSNYYVPLYRNPALENLTGSLSESYSTAYIEKPELTIPPKTMVNISEYKLANTTFKHCDLEEYPNRKEVKAMVFNKENSPFRFYNLITYSVKGDTIRMENKFYVSEITNYPSTMMYTEIDTDACGNKLYYPISAIKKGNPDKFYIKYNETAK